MVKRNRGIAGTVCVQRIGDKGSFFITVPVYIVRRMGLKKGDFIAFEDNQRYGYYIVKVSNEVTP